MLRSQWCLGTRLAYTPLKIHLLWHIQRMCDSPEVNPAPAHTPTAVLPLTGWVGVGVPAKAATAEILQN